MTEYLDKYNQFLQSEQGTRSINAKTYLVVDGLNLFFRTFSVVPTLNENGEHTGGVVGFYRTLKSLVNSMDVDEVVIVFDGKGGNARRRKLYSGYKENRKSMGMFNRFEEVKEGVDEQESMKRQLSLLLNSLNTLPVRVIVIDGVEADDVIAYCVNEGLPEDSLKIIASGDKDYLQLVRENINVYSLYKKKLITYQNFHETVGYLPQNFLTLRCFTGDSSDNIDGVYKVGEKSLCKLFELNTTEKIISIDEIVNESFNKVQAGTKTKMYYNIVDHKYIAYRNYELMQLTEPPINGILASKVRSILDNNPEKFNKLAYHKIMLNNGIDYNVEDLTMWERLDRQF